MPNDLWKFVVDELDERRAGALRPRRRPGQLPPALITPDLSTVRVLSERAAGDRGAVALTVNGTAGDRFLIVRELLRDPERPDAWLLRFGSEGIDRVIPGKRDPYVSLSAHASGGFSRADGSRARRVTLRGFV